MEITPTSTYLPRPEASDPAKAEPVVPVVVPEAKAPAEDTLEISTAARLTLNKETIATLSGGPASGKPLATEANVNPPDISDVGCPTK